MNGMLARIIIRPLQLLWLLRGHCMKLVVIQSLNNPPMNPWMEVAQVHLEASVPFLCPRLWIE